MIGQKKGETAMTKQSQAFHDDILNRLQDIRDEGLYKDERQIASWQGAEITLDDGRTLINLCANNYLGYSGDPMLVEAGKAALEDRGFGLSSVRFICGTQDIHKQLEAKLAAFLGFEDTILFPSCFDANGGIFETFFTAEDAIISDALNHASIIDGVRLCKAQRFRYANRDMKALEDALVAAKDARYRLIVTDGVFSMDGYIAPLREICDLADAYDALVMVDDSHAVGVLGQSGKGSHEFCDAMGRVDFLTGTLGKALGGASGGYVAASVAATDLLRQKARPYLFSNALAPMIAETTMTVLDDLEAHPERLSNLHKNARYFRENMTAAGFELLDGETPIIPVMLRDPKLAQAMAQKLDEFGVYVAAFSFPVVPRQEDRIRTQISSAHEINHLDRAVDAFRKAGKALGVIS